jgi:hypothetical protein
MLRARLYLDGSKVLWALVQCAQCRVVHKYSMDEVILGPLVCRQCRHEMDVRNAMREAAVDWVETHPRSATISQDVFRKLTSADETGPDVPAPK